MSVISETINIAYSFLASVCRPDQLKSVEKNLKEITGSDELCMSDIQSESGISYSKAQDLLSKINERESIRKAKGVYYTPVDVVQYIVDSTFGLSSGKEKDELSFLPEDIDYKNLCKKKKAFDPTCGAGEFLLALMDKKFDIWENNEQTASKKDVESIVETIYGNDINPDSITITKLRLYLCAVNRFGVEKCIDLPSKMREQFTCIDYVVNPPVSDSLYDIVIGNPPYVEDAKCGLDLVDSYGNIYANVLVNVAKRLKKGGIFGFIIPLSYVSTPRMKKLRDELYDVVPEQYILSFSDRPDCLFRSVHQKLCILICRKGSAKKIYTSNYQYWYKEERNQLFKKATIVRNEYGNDKFIPKLGNEYDVEVYKKVVSHSEEQSIQSLRRKEGPSVFINMRAAFWIKAFMNPHAGAEYREFCFETQEMADYMMCLFNSSLFWWYWVCISDCWHITLKELVSFGVPSAGNYSTLSKLAKQMDADLERTKVYVGTVQTDYEYKHKSCVETIRKIDDCINKIYGLTKEESEYIKRFAYQYRISGGATNESN